MSNADSTDTAPLIIGGETTVGCELLGTLIGLLPQISSARSSRLLCHPGLWVSPKEIENWEDHISRYLFENIYGFISRPDAGRLLWCDPDLSALTGNLLSESRIREFLHASSDIREFIDQLTESVMATKNTNHWLDHTPENIYTMEAILETFPHSRGINIVRDGRAAVFDRIQQDFSPKAAVNIWLVETAIGQYLQAKHVDTGRMLTVRLEDLLEQPKVVLAKVIEHFQLSAVGSSDFDSVDWLSSETSPLEPDLLDRIFQLKNSLYDWQTELPEKFKQYLYGTNPEIDKLTDRGFHALEASGAELLNHLGYPAIRHELKKVKLSKSEQSLKHEHSKFVNLLAQYRLPQADIESVPHPHHSDHHQAHDLLCLKCWADEVKTDSFHRGRHPLHYVFCLKCWYRKFKHYSSPASDSLDKKEEPVPARKIIPDSKPGDQKNNTLHEPSSGLSPSDTDLAVVIAFAGRHRILELVVEELSRATDDDWKLEVILVCSSEEDESFVNELKEKHPFVHVKVHPNQPLGAKWQAGVEEARGLEPRNLMILGSDDILSPRFLTNALRLMEQENGEFGFDLVAPSFWHLYDCDPNSSYSGSLWKLTYQNHQPVPLGAGRIYSADILNRFDWRLFHIDLRVGLDSRGFQQVLAHHGNVYRLPQSMGTVLSVKGGWSNLNSTDKILGAASVRSHSVDFSKADFFSENFSFTEKELTEWFRRESE